MDTQVFDKVTDKKNSGEDDISKDNASEFKKDDESNNSKKKGKNAPSEFVKGVFDWASAFLFAIVVVVLVLTFCVRVVSIDGDSMLQTLQDKNKVIVTGLDYDPQVGDIVVISHGATLDKVIVKRVIATEGQTVDINGETGEVSVDGIVLDEPYINGKTEPKGDVEFPVTVEPGTVFVLGDNRPISDDSRYSEVGMVEEGSIIGKVQFRFYPFDKFGKVE
ncbi:MAG: signal peptidase I [Clostridia bacterium]|nr:signal peptidase I [Clostridia bacterium]